MRSKYKWIFTLLVALSVQFSFAQEKTVTGVVSDASGTLPGANVVVQGTKTSTQTDANGKYTIKAKVGDVLVFSFVNYTSATAKIGAANVYNAKLSEGKILDNVTITGAMGIKRKKDAVTNSYSTVSNQELKTASNPDAVRSLAGKVSGLTVSATGTGVNGSNSIRIRSMLSVSGSTEALVVIDNVISTADVMATLPPDAIENVTILKGAQGAALYGAQGKQGVVLVTTKKGGKDEKFKVDFTSSNDIEEINFVPQRQTTYGQGWYGSWDPQENGGWGELYDGSIRQVGIPLPDGSFISAPYSSRGENSLKDFYQTGTINQNNLNVKMGGADSYFNFNLGNVRRSFILEGDNLNRNTIVLNAGKKMGKLNMGGSFNFINTNTKQANVNAATSRGDYTLLTNLLQTAGNIPILEFKDRGLFGWNGYYQNPWWAKDNNRLQENANFFNFGLNADYQLNKNINLAYNGSLQYRTTNQMSYANAGLAPAAADADFSSGSEYYRSIFESTYYYGDFLANFNYDLADKIGMKFTLGQNFQYSASNRISQGGVNLEIPGFYHISNVLSPDNPNDLRNNNFITKTTATFGNLDLNYDDYLFLNATARYEGNSVGSKGNQFFFYPSAGVSFVPTKFFSDLKDKKILSNLKLYANYTKIGSLDPIDAYEVLNTAVVASNYAFPDTGNSYRDKYTLTDPNIKPEMYTTIEGGMNFGFLNDRITLDVAGYMTTTKDLITLTSVSTATGFTRSKSNLGELEGKGFEIDLGFMPFKTENFNWNGRLNFTHNETITVDAGETSSIPLNATGNANMDANIFAVDGLPFPQIQGTDWIRDNQGRVILDVNGAPAPSSVFTPLGRVTPKYIVGLYNKFDYKGISLAITADYRTGHYFLSQTKYNLTWNGHLADSGEFDRNVGFIMPNSVIADPLNPGQYIANTTQLTGGQGTYNIAGAGNLTQTYYGLAAELGAHNVVDATSFRIREISLGYSIPRKIVEKIGLEAFKFSVNARNPFIWLADSNRGYADPEAASQYNSSTTTAAKNPSGTVGSTARNGVGFIGDATYPSTRTFGFTLNVTF